MAITNIGFVGTVGEVDYSRLTDYGTRPSVITEDDWRVTAVTSNRQVAIAEGSGYKAGILSTSSDTVILSLDAPVATNAMWYLIVARRTWGDTRSCTFVAVPGDGIPEYPARTPPRYYPDGVKNSPGVQDDQPLAWAFVNKDDNDVQVFDLRDLPPGSLPGMNYRGEGAAGGYSQNPNQAVNHVSVPFTLGIQRWVQVEASIALFPGGNVAGELQIMQDGTIIHERRWHSHAIQQRMDPSTTYSFSIQPGNHSIALRLVVDGASSSSVLVYDAALVISAAPA